MVTYEWIATRFVQALEKAVADDPGWRHDARIFCNRATLDRVRPHAKSVSECLLTTTGQEEALLAESLVPWAEQGIGRWIDHMKGIAEYSEGYVRMLERVRSEFAFDAIVAWGTNGIVRTYARANGVLPLFAELGPIRQPFIATGVIDSLGVNGDSRIAVGDFAWDRVPDTVPPLLHANLRSERWESAPKPSHPESYVLVPLQTADDANILVHNEGKSYEAEIVEAVARISATGVTCVVKTHPGARHLPFNALAQARLVETLLQIPRVVVLDRALEGAAYARLLLDASAVATFNSSLGFEASLLGTPTHVMARAGYAPPGVFAGFEEIANGMPRDTPWLARMAHLHALLTQRYLLDLDDVFDFPVLHDVACFWKDTERRTLTPPMSGPGQSRPLLRLINALLSRRWGVTPESGSERCSPLGIRLEGPS